jgi:hypothetical protein
MTMGSNPGSSFDLRHICVINFGIFFIIFFFLMRCISQSAGISLYIVSKLGFLVPSQFAVFFHCFCCSDSRASLF